MTVHKCNHEGEIATMKAAIERLDKDINGNGKPGMRDTVTEMCTELRNHTIAVESLKTAVSGLAKFETEVKATDRTKDRQFTRTITIIGAVLTLLTIVNVIINFV